MNQCLSVPELVIEICLQCDKQTLATLGRTARVFDCALDALWSGCHDEGYRIYLDALIQCFPSEIWTCPEGSRFSFLGAIEPQHWDRLNFYARRVKAFKLDMSKIDPAFFTSLVDNKPPGSILPNLKDLVLYADVEDELAHAYAFLSPNLQILDIEVLQEESITGSILASLFHAIPMISANINTLKVCIIYSPVYLPAFHTLLGHLHNLHQLVLGFITTGYLPLITSLPRLTHLTIYCIEDSKAVTPPALTFASNTLTCLDLSGNPKRTKHICALFKLLSKCPLECVVLRTFRLRQASDFAEIVRAVTDRCRPHTLYRVRIVENLGNPVEIGVEHLAPFLAFPNITRFEHRHVGPLHLDDSFISSLATSWPNLEHLYLGPGLYGPRAVTPRVTAKSFAFLAFHCPRLSFVGLAFDATTVASVMSKDVGDCPDDKQGSFSIHEVCNRSVHTLTVGYSPIAEPTLVSEFMRSIFPNLTQVNFYAPLSMGPAAGEMYIERWKSVTNGLERVRPS